ncbi:flagellar assembly protein FlgT [Shewanella sp. GutDb-MelDb]|uniref:flagellar assembly protein FlgT n=1 Tax=Shewanella sp. GutDb-MelDb TaxID=2058316 RepID=UPI000C7C442D|nr:flagellar assembly protein FlgT [Shewanella sp. GutDb-MelDb]PKG58582.1 flagellar biosynthesis protein FlgT [Shewanella sp. GutDb-MelDb]
MKLGSCIIKVILACSLVLTAPVQAKWTQATGQAKIVDNNLAKAREDAIEQAISYATLKTGAHFSSEQTVSNGQLVNDSFTLSRNVQSQQVEMVSELVEDGYITVNIRIDMIEPFEQACQASELKASILVPQASIKDRSQLRYGNLGLFEQNLSEQLAQVIEANSSSSFTHLHANERLDVDQTLVDVRGYRLPSWLGEITDSQYILLPEIIDISPEPSTRTFGLWENDPMRVFQFKLSLFHAISGEKVWSKQYSKSAEWEFSLQQTVNSNSDQFWRSEYGAMISTVLLDASQDIDQALNCRPLLGQVIAKQANRIILNIGRRNGIRVGDTLQLVLQQNMPDRLDNMRAVAGKSKATITIDQVTEESATAVLKGLSASLNIQINDLAIKL